MVYSLDNLDHNPSSITSTDYFHGTGISLFQFPTTCDEGIFQATSICISVEKTSLTVLKPQPEKGEVRALDEKWQERIKYQQIGRDFCVMKRIKKNYLSFYLLKLCISSTLITKKFLLLMDH